MHNDKKYLIFQNNFYRLSHNFCSLFSQFEQFDQIFHVNLQNESGNGLSKFYMNNCVYQSEKDLKKSNKKKKKHSDPVASKQ